MKFLSLNIMINAWLDCNHPFISLHNKHDGDLLAFFGEEKVRHLIAEGEISVDELSSTNPTSQLDTIATLLRTNAQYH